jgi:PPK2 family polyphosphate:nucleotide phosphotransferase
MRDIDADRIENVLRRYRVTSGRRFRLEDYDPGDTQGFDSQKDKAKELLAHGIEWLAEEQEKLYANGHWGVLLIFQAMDAAGKDSTIEHVMSGVNPQGVHVTSFKAPSSEELAHDFLWRCAKALPERGRIGIFNRSYYEEVLVVRVHKELLARQNLPSEVQHGDVWSERCEDIAAFERHLARNGYVILKFFLNVSRDEQKRRFLARLDEPEKNWKFSPADVKERAFWNDYMAAYERAIRRTAAAHAPWYVVPADNKWYTRLVVALAIVDAIERLKLTYPKTKTEVKREFDAARKLLMRKGG